MGNNLNKKVERSPCAVYSLRVWPSLPSSPLLLRFLCGVPQVILTITALGRLLQTIMPGAPFPKLGVKVMEKTERVFTEDQLREARMAVSVLNLGSSNMGRQAFESVLQGKQALADVVGEGTKVQAIKTTVRAPEIVAAEAAAAEAAAAEAKKNSSSASAATTSAAISVTASPTSASTSSSSAAATASSSSSSSDSSSSLPAGWKELKTSDGRAYFFNESANKTQWERPVAETDAAALPAGWEENKTPEGKVYYYHSGTKKTQWERPSGDGGAAPLPAGWEELKTPDGKVYFYNDATKSTQWDRPT